MTDHFVNDFLASSLLFFLVFGVHHAWFLIIFSVLPSPPLAVYNGLISDHLVRIRPPFFGVALNAADVDVKLNTFF